MGGALALTTGRVSGMTPKKDAWLVLKVETLNLFSVIKMRE